MRRALVSVAFVAAATAAACSFKVGSNPDAQNPQGSGTSTGAPSTAATAAPTATSTGTPGIAMGRAKRTTPTPTATATGPSTIPTAPATTPTSPAPSGVPILTGANAFGSGTPDPTGWKGTIYWLPPGAQKLPQLQSLTPAGLLFAKQLATSPRAFTEGFPGIDANRREDFAIRFEAPLVVDNEADYELRIVSDDGSLVIIDGTTIVDNDGAHDLREKSGPVHLVKGTHTITVDYFQTKGSVALQLFCKKRGGAEQICPTRL
jgi:hypothetical protein